MTQLRDLIFARCSAHAGLLALLNHVDADGTTRVHCFPERLPERVVYPAIRYLAPVSGNDGQYRTQDSTPVERTVSRVQFDCYDDTGDRVEDLAKQLKLAWSGYSDPPDVGYAFIANDVQGRDDVTETFRQIVDVMVEHLVDT